MKTKDVSQQVEVDATPPFLVSSVSVKIIRTPGGYRVAALDTEHVEDVNEDVELFAAIGAKMNPRKWMKKRESQIGELDKLKLKLVVLYNMDKTMGLVFTSQLENMGWLRR